MGHNVTKSVWSAVSILGVAAPAWAADPIELDSGWSFQYYGQFNPAYQVFDDGIETYNIIVDNTHSNSRVGLVISRPVGENTFSFRLETALGFRPSAEMSQNFTPDAWKWSETNLRHADFSYQGAGFGKVSFGQGSMATDGIATVDTTGASLVAYSGLADTAGGFQFRTESGDLSGVRIGQAFRTFDGPRRGRVRYDSPEFAGVSVSASYGEEILVSELDQSMGDIAMRYQQDSPNHKLLVGVGARWTDNTLTPDTHNVIGSVGYNHKPSAIAFTVAAGTEDVSGHYVHAQVG